MERASASCTSAFSTNTFPPGKLAHPFRFVAHNGEINTVRGNVNWMHARQSILESPLFGDDLKKLFPIIQPGGSDSAAFDNALELLVQSGRSLPHASPCSSRSLGWQPQHGGEQESFLRISLLPHGAVDGPAAITFTDGRVIGATLDRQRPSACRYVVTHDGLAVLASETGVLPIKPEDVKLKGRLQPGKMFLIDLEQGRIVSDKEIKDSWPIVSLIRNG